MVALVGAYILYRMYRYEREEDEVVGATTPSYTVTPDDAKIADLKGYLTSVLDDFFKVQRAVLTEIEKCKVREEQK